MQLLASHMQLKFIYKDILKVQVLNFDILKLPGCSMNVKLCALVIRGMPLTA